LSEKTDTSRDMQDSGTSSAMRRGRPPKGDSAESRQKLLAAAMALFSEQGLDSVSTRQLAGSAGVNLSAIAYHFGGKEQLYEAAVRHAMDELAPRRKAVISHLETILEEAGGDRIALAGSIKVFVRRIFTILVQDNFPIVPIRMLMREIHHPTSSFNLVIEGHINPIQDAVAGLAATALGQDISDPEARLLGMTVTSQVFMLGIMKPIVLARMGWSSYSDENTEFIIKSTTTSILRLLGLPENAES
jgi:TetR/AcrR family transcriptional regulator, regulator of cefoperazone and chloramphenicol sensitivity